MGIGIAAGLYFEGAIDITDGMDATASGSQTYALVSEYKVNGANFSTNGGPGYVFRNTALSCTPATYGANYISAGGSPLGGTGGVFAKSCQTSSIPPPVGGTLPD